LSAEPARPGLPLRAQGISAGYGGDAVIRDITVAVAPGEVVSMVGPNGSGKSTLLTSLVGLVWVARGTVRVGEADPTNRPPEEIARAGVGYVHQVDDVFSSLSVRENLEMGGYLLRRHEITGRIERVLAIFPRLSSMLGRSAGKLSGGEGKMLAMGRVAGALPSEHVRQLAVDGAAVLVVEQRARAVLAISDRTYVLGGGQVRMTGTPAELAASPVFVESFLGGGHAAAPSGDV
jgi:ABC-type branched-subunit amino acid transport system ATPase component